MSIAIVSALIVLASVVIARGTARVDPYAQHLGLPASSSRKKIATAYASIEPRRPATYQEILAAAKASAPPLSAVSIRESPSAGVY